MKRIRRSGCWLAVAALIALSQSAHAQTVLPSNPNSTCTVSAVEIAGWFTSGTVTANGGVDPADSVLFPNVPNCSFYKWSEQMFLWLTSPAPSKYGKGTHVFDSPVFYDVSPPDSGGQRTLSANVGGRLKIFGSRISQLGPKGQPVIFDKSGKRFNLIRPEVGPTGKPVIRNKAGQRIEIERTEVDPAGKPIFRDKAGKAIDFPATTGGLPRLRDRAGRPIDFRLNKAVINGRTFFLDGAGNAIETETGQADGSVLMAQGSKLVYYALHVNDVFAYFLTGTKNGSITPTPTRFPTTPADLNKIIAFGMTHNKTFPDANALAVELKSSWIEAAGLDTSKFVTMTATIPTFDTSNSLHWVQNGSKQALLAMTGMHVVGSTAGHSEMLWATFEHVSNTRNAPYTYNKTGGGTAAVASEVGGTWLFSTTPASGPPAPNNPLIFLDPATGDLLATGATPIGPTDVLRVNPWGTSGPGGAFNANNTDLIAINNSVINQLIAPDVRKNYMMTGVTWTPFGAVPTGNNGVGTNNMANSTMETFFQPSNCFACHDGSNMLGSLTNGFSSGLSHIWGGLKPLFP